MATSLIIPKNINNFIAEVDESFDCSYLQEGDLYVGKRNTGWEFGICKKVENGCVMAVSAMIYSYDTCECKKIIRMINLNNVKIA